ncbi:MAG: hypothetical protein ALECFALPRED_009499 [Alectoria fallacina]|uniref:DUF7704 domain-containing protein n=1 Tax=Alectoria fallacina TaxID=1903189 RepID=A0A8H3F1V6_9LECA|nr:MAG: hypothetical protein ALECFALPRED_009499 [Alectoria fallacina]
MDTEPPIPFSYRFLFLYFEPLGAFFGTIINILDPLRYLQSLSPTATASAYSPLTQPIYDQLAAHLLFFSWSQAVVLRSTDDVKVWKSLLFGMFLCDILHLFASYRVLGPEVFFSPSLWRWEEWVNFVMLYGPGGLRLAFCAGVGVRSGEHKAIKSF